MYLFVRANFGIWYEYILYCRSSPFALLPAAEWKKYCDDIGLFCAVLLSSVPCC